MAIDQELTNVRLFVGRLAGIPTIVMMAFFEGFIQRFMPYLAELAARQGSHEREYTDVHGVCDTIHTRELFYALSAERSLRSSETPTDLFEGVRLLRALLHVIVHPPADCPAHLRV